MLCTELVLLPDYRGLQEDIDVIYECTGVCHLTPNPLKCKYLIASRKRQPHLPPGGLLLGNYTMEQVESYIYVGALMISTLAWKNHIQHICTKAMKLVGLLHGQFSTWADTKTLGCLYPTCIRPHLVCLSIVGSLHKSGHSIIGILTKVCLQSASETMEPSV